MPNNYAHNPQKKKKKKNEEIKKKKKKIEKGTKKGPSYHGAKTGNRAFVIYPSNLSSKRGSVAASNNNHRVVTCACIRGTYTERDAFASEEAVHRDALFRGGNVYQPVSCMELPRVDISWHGARGDGWTRGGCCRGWKGWRWSMVRHRWWTPRFEACNPHFHSSRTPTHTFAHCPNHQPFQQPSFFFSIFFLHVFYTFLPFLSISLFFFWSFPCFLVLAFWDCSSNSLEEFCQFLRGYFVLFFWSEFVFVGVSAIGDDVLFWILEEV